MPFPRYVSMGIAGVLLLLSEVYAPAQVSNELQVGPRATTRHKHHGMDDQVDAMARFLDLNESQRTSMKTILQQRQQEILDMRRSPSGARDNPTDRFRLIEDKTVERIRAMLNEGQREKYDPIGVRKTAPAAQRQQVHDWLKSTMPK